MKTWLISLSVLALLVLLGTMLPALLERNAVRHSVLEMNDAIRAEDPAALETLIMPAQRQSARLLFESVLPGHGGSVRHLRIKSMQRQPDGSYQLDVVLSLDDPSWGRQLYEGRLLFEHDGSRWLWNFEASEGRQFSLVDEGSWTKVADWLNLAQP